MASESTLDPENFPVGGRPRERLKGHDIGSLGPSDSSDSGSDLAGARPNAADLSLDRGADEDSTVGHSNDIDTDRVVQASEAGLGGEMEKRAEWQFVDTGRDTWMWVVAHPDGTRSESAEEFRTLGECTSDAAQHGYVVWKSEEERRRASQLGVMDALKRIR